MEASYSPVKTGFLLCLKGRLALFYELMIRWYIHRPSNVLKRHFFGAIKKDGLGKNGFGKIRVQDLRQARVSFYRAGETPNTIP
jgi:hypothetical protein